MWAGGPCYWDLVTIEAERSCPEGRDASIEQMDSYVDSARIGESTMVLHKFLRVGKLSRTPTVEVGERPSRFKHPNSRPMFHYESIEMSYHGDR